MGLDRAQGLVPQGALQADRLVRQRLVRQQLVQVGRVQDRPVGGRLMQVGRVLVVLAVQVQVQQGPAQAAAQVAEVDHPRLQTLLLLGALEQVVGLQLG